MRKSVQPIEDARDARDLGDLDAMELCRECLCEWDACDGFRRWRLDKMLDGLSHLRRAA